LSRDKCANLRIFRPLVTGTADHIRYLSSEFEVVIVARAADAVPALLSSPAASDAALVKAMFQLLKVIPGGIQAVVSRPAIIVALEDYCLRVPFAEGPALEAALLLCEVYQKSPPRDGAKLTRLFNPWLTDMVRTRPAQYSFPLTSLIRQSPILRQYPS
jgi:hypothetical protein